MNIQLEKQQQNEKNIVHINKEEIKENDLKVNNVEKNNSIKPNITLNKKNDNKEVITSSNDDKK